MQRATHHTTVMRRLAGAIIGSAALLTTTVGPAAASPITWLDSLSAAPAPTGPLAYLNDYCQDHGAVGYLSDGRTVYCTRVARTDAYVWSYSPDLMPIDPNTRRYSCDSNMCRFPDGSIAPNYIRCGTLCGEPPTSGDIQSGFYDCFHSGMTYEQCRQRSPR